MTIANGSHPRLAVFAGPSISLAELERMAPGFLFPPAACGDVLAALRVEPNAVVLIDGIFEHCAAVWHKEILAVLERGVPVYGAASMGALRAAELAPFGMRGAGWIYRQYRTGRLRDDDEVAVSHHDKEGGFRPVSIPLVNIRRTVSAALRNGALEVHEARALVARAKETFYPHRDIAVLVDEALRPWRCARDRQMLTRHLTSRGYIDQKAIDARLILRVALNAWRDGTATPKAAFVHQSAFFRKLHGESLCRPVPTPLNAGALEMLPPAERMIAAGAKDPLFPLVQRLALLLVAAEALARRAGVALDSHSDTRCKSLMDCLQRRERQLRIGRRRPLFQRFTRALLPQCPTQSRRATAAVEAVARFWCWLDAEAEAAGLGPASERQQRLSDDFRKGLGLESECDTHTWLRKHNLTVPQYRRFLIAWDRMIYVGDSFNVQVLGYEGCLSAAPWLVEAFALAGLDINRRIERQGNGG